MTRLTSLAFCLSVGLLSGCGRGPVQIDDGGEPGGGDAGSIQIDSGSDAGTNAGTDAGTDAGSSTVMDAGADAGRDAGVDAGTDAGTDAGVDAGVDAGLDAGTDAGTDAGFTCGAPIIVQTNMASWGLTPSAVVDETGAATVAWRESDSAGRTTIWGSRWSGDAGWSTFPFTTDGGTFSVTPRLTANANGEVMVWWFEPNGSTSNFLWSSRYRPDAGWSAAQNVLSTSWNLMEANIALDSHGTAVAAFSQYPAQSGFQAIWISRAGPTGPWSPAQRADGYTGAVSLTDHPKVAPGQGGEFVSVWLDQTTNPANVRGTVVWADGGLSAPIPIDSASTNIVRLAFAGRQDGDGMVTWQQYRSTNDGSWDAYAARYRPDAGFLPATAIEYLDAGNVYQPAVSIDGQGRALVAWSQTLAGNTPRAAVFDPATGWSTAVLKADQAGGSAQNVVTAMNLSGSGAVAWHEPGVVVRPVSASGVVGPRVSLNGATNIVGSLALAVGPTGAVLVVFSAPVGGTSNQRVHATWCQ